MMSDKPLLADRRPAPVGDEVKALSEITARMKSKRVSHNSYNGANRRKAGGTRTLNIRLDSSDYARLKNAIDATPAHSIESFCKEAILKALEETERENGGPFRPSRTLRPKRSMLQSVSKHAVDFYV
jgi:hypothetical protein